MKSNAFRLFGVLTLLAFGVTSQAAVQILVGHNRNEAATPEFKFANVPPPIQNDAAAQARFVLVDGRRDRNGGDVAKLHDGFIPAEDDEPSENLFFNAGTEGGRLLVDLGSLIEIEQVNSYSWHVNTRAPQVYRLYASDGQADGFDAQPKQGADPAACGWRLIATVDTRPKEAEGGGQYGVSITDSDGILGRYQYLLFDISRTEAGDPFGNTFYSEIDVVAPRTARVVATPVPRTGRKTIEAGGGTYRITIDTTETPDLAEWVEQELVPAVQAWYPKIVKLLPSDGYEAPRRISIVFSRDMRGVAATSGTLVRVAAGWFRDNLKGESKGSVIHELVHVVQQYGRARRTNPNATRSPGWLVEGVADYIRWFLFEPESRGAEVSRRNLARARYDASYRVSANFLNWVVENHDRDIVTELNRVLREGNYQEEMWKQHTGHTLQELGDQWKAYLEKKLAADATPTP